jgi:hypothetical protein
MSSIVWGKRVVQADLRLSLRSYLPELDRQLALRNLRVLAYLGWRSTAEQLAYWMQGREPLEAVNKARATAGLPSLEERDNARRVTWARPGTSPHEHGFALDCVPLARDGKPLWQHGPHWRSYGEAVRAAGLTWGGLFAKGTMNRPSDGPHLELTGWKDEVKHAAG